jgi:hypothetical protein
MVHCFPGMEGCAWASALTKLNLWQSLPNVRWPQTSLLHCDVIKRYDGWITTNFKGPTDGGRPLEEMSLVIRVARLEFD